MSLLLKRNGIIQDPSATGHSLGRLTQSFLKPFQLTVRRAIPFDDTFVWENEQAFSLSDTQEGTLFDGLLKSNRREAAVDRDATSFLMMGLEAKADRITFAKDGSARVVYNALPEEASTGDYYPARSGMSIGAILADVLDSMAAELSGILGDGTPGSACIPEEIALLTLVPPKIILSGCSVGECIRILLRHQPQFGSYLDPALHQIRIIDLADLQDKTITVGSDAVIEANLNFSTEGCFTACKIEGAGELIDKEVELTPAWDTELEPGWTIQKAYEQPETYGRVWRRFACPDTNLAPYRVVGDGPRILLKIDNGWQKLFIVICEWAAVDFEHGEIELPWLARQWVQGLGAWGTASVRMRYTYRYGPISARWPRTGFHGTACTNRGVEAEKIIVDHDAMRVTVLGTINKLESPTSFRDFLIGLKPGELAGKFVSFGGSPDRYPIIANDTNLIEIEYGPELEAGVQFTIYLNDDTALDHEGNTISRMELMAREWLKARKDEQYNGVVPLAGVDLSVKLGQKISFAGTDNPFYSTLGATLIEVVHDLERDRTELVLTSDRTLGEQKLWKEQQEKQEAEQRHRDLRGELVLLRRTVGSGRALLLDGDRDTRIEASPSPPFTSLGKYGDPTVFTGDVKLEEDSEDEPSVVITPIVDHNSLKLGANFAVGDDIEPVSLHGPELGSSGHVPDAAHRHDLDTNHTLIALDDHTLSHAPKENFAAGVVVSGYYFSFTWDNIYGHILSITSQGA